MAKRFSDKSKCSDAAVSCDVIVVGSGVSGMTAAIRAKETAVSSSVLVLEKNKKSARKLYATGNGRCNLANTHLDLSCYYSSNEFFPYEVINTRSYMEVTDFFRGLGVEIYDDDGYLYPMSLQASTVAWALTDRMRLLGVDVHTSEEVMRICRDMDNRGYLVYTEKGLYRSASVIVAPGSAAAPGLGGSENVYSLLDGLDSRRSIAFAAPRPALCRLRCADDISSLAGVRAKAEVRLFCDGSLYASESGEVQFTDGFLSGIAVFNLSMECISLLDENASGDVYIETALVPGMTEDELVWHIQRFSNENGKRRVHALLAGLVNEKLAAYILERSGISATLADGLTDKDAAVLAHLLKTLRFDICGHAGYEDSQAASGGVDTRCIRPDSMELDGYQGLYVTGEYADVTGKCGGYNIMWAVVSGMRAGIAAGYRSTSKE